MVTVKLAIAYLSGNVDMNMELTEAQRPVRAQYAGKVSVAGTNVALTAGFDLLLAGTGTKVAWQGEAEMCRADWQRWQYRCWSRRPRKM